MPELPTNIKEYIDGTEPIKTYYSALLDTGEPFKVEVWLSATYYFDEVAYIEEGPLKGLPDYSKSKIKKVTVGFGCYYVDIDTNKAWTWDEIHIAEGKTLEEAVENFKKEWVKIKDLKKFLREHLNAPKRLFDTLEEAREYGEALKIRNSLIREMEVLFDTDLDHLVTLPL